MDEIEDAKATPLPSGQFTASQPLTGALEIAVEAYRLGLYREDCRRRTERR